jgi:hypothetical protein
MVAIGVLLLASASGAGAASLARGAGTNETCSHYLVEVANKSSVGNVLQQWALAFVTGYMAHLSLTDSDDDPTERMSNEEVLRAVQTYCGKQPSSRLVDALTVFAYASSIANKKFDARKK